MDKKANQNLREFTRIPIHVMVEIKAGETVFKTDKTQDLSMKGLFLHCDKLLPVKSQCDVSLIIGSPKNPIRIDIKGRVTRSGDSGMGIEFTEIDLDSYDYLQNLIMYNSHTGIDAVEEEIHSHLGLKKRV